MRRLILFFICLFVIISTVQANRPRVGLVLSGGGAKGVAHLGALKILDSLNIPIDYIAGTSMGGLIGALYAIGYSADDIDSIVMSANWEELLSDLPQRKDLPYFEKKLDGRYQLSFDLKGITPVLPMGLIEGQKIMLLFSKLTYPFGTKMEFDRLPIPFRCVAVDLITGKEVVLSRGSLATAMRATMSIPSVFSPVEWGDSLLIDGGLVNNLPVDVVKQMGAEVVIAVNVGTQLKSRKHLKTVLDIFEQSFNIPHSYKEAENLRHADILIAPDLTNFTIANFSQSYLRQMKKLGHKAALKALPELKKLKQTIQQETLPGNQIRVRRNILKLNRRTVIHRIQIKGNRQLPYTFIYNLLGIVPGDTLDLDKLNRNVMLLYSLNYFRRLNYELVPLSNNRVALKLYVTERPVRKLRLGFRYDDYRHLVMVLGVNATNVVLPGLRAEMELQFPELTWLRYKLSYPSRSLNQPLYPYVRAEHRNIPHDVYDETGRLAATYDEKSLTIAAGLGVLIGKSLNIETEINYEINRSKPELSPMDTVFNAYFRKIQIAVNYDHLDNVLLPKKGIMIDGNFESSLEQLGSSQYFYRMDVNAAAFFTVTHSHTFRLNAYYAYGSSDMPIFKKFTVGGPGSFIGAHYEQYSARRAGVLGGFYRYRYKKDIFFKLYLNTMFHYDYLFSNTPLQRSYITGFGLGLKLMSILGPIEMIVAGGHKSFNSGNQYQTVVYFTAGYQF